mmetsp:Transcript_3044/g.4438  ORF Transcript_3044/g.4438 Transcript_3044/m.4438 type:complete len:604 (+) Transcript_3044:147-1958(+)
MSSNPKSGNALSKEEKKRLKRERKRDKKRSRQSIDVDVDVESNTATTSTTAATTETTKRDDSSTSMVKPSPSSPSPSPSSSSKRLKREDPKLPSALLKNESLPMDKQKQKQQQQKPASGLKQIRIKTSGGNNESSQLRVRVAASSSSDPIVVSFPAGLPYSMTSNSNAATTATASSSTGRSVRFENDGRNRTNINSNPPVFTWAKVRKSSSRGRVIHGTDDTCTYISSNEGRGHDGRHTRFYVGLYHKPTGTLKLVPSSEKGTVFAMNQSVTSYNDSKSLDVRNLSLAERRRMVFEAFGSQKKKKVLRSQQANIVEMKSVVGAGEGMMKALGKQMDGNMMSESNRKVMEDLRNRNADDLGGSGKTMTAVERAYADARRNFLPPFDESAQKPYKVYDSQEVAGEDAWAQISRTVDACLHKGDGDGDEWRDAIQGRRGWPESTKALLQLVHDPQTKRGAKYQLKTIVLVNYLVRFHNKASKKFMAGSEDEMQKFLGLPQEVTEKFLGLFCVPTYENGRAGFAISKQLKDRRVVYTLIMYLMAHGKDMKVGSIEKICDDLRLETKDAMSFYREAGCTCVKNKVGMVSVSLKVPLVFPPPKRGKKSK